MGIMDSVDMQVLCTVASRAGAVYGASHQQAKQTRGQMSVLHGSELLANFVKANYPRK